MCLGVYAQQISSAELQWTNLGELRAPTSGEHVLSGRSAAVYNLEQLRAELAPFAFQEPVEFTGSSGPEQTNLGPARAWQFQGHKLTKGAEGAPYKILYAPSEADDVAYRNAMAAAAGGGSTCDYFDARTATPSVATLTQYDVVLVWANYAFADNITYGNNLAAYNDAGGTVVLGAFCAYTSGNFLSGSIMTAAYCPVLGGSNHFSNSSYLGDGTTCIYTGVSSLAAVYRDILSLQGTGVIDGTFADGEICHAYRGTNPAGAGDVVYSNGNGGFPVAGTGQWANIAANLCGCSPASAPTTILYAPSEGDDAAYRAAISAAAGGATVDYFDASAGTPSAALLATYTGVHVWANFAFADKTTYGNNLATFVDNGGDVVMGAFCTYTNGNSLGGTIMTSAYSPVWSPSGSNHFSFDTYTGGACSCLFAGVTTLGGTYRDILALQGAGIRDGQFPSDKEIVQAYRHHPGGSVGDVVYCNGAGGFPLDSTADYPVAIANGLTCDPGQTGVSAAATFRGSSASCGLTPNPADYTVSSLPVVGSSFVGVVATGGGTINTVIGFWTGTGSACIFGYELLCGPAFPIATSTSPSGTHKIPLQDACYIGLKIYSQGLRVESSGPPIFLTNAQDLLLGL
jgi:hypothetical protein